VKGALAISFDIEIIAKGDELFAHLVNVIPIGAAATQATIFLSFFSSFLSSLESHCFTSQKGQAGRRTDKGFLWKQLPTAHLSLLISDSRRITAGG
jgi:hypothetical protein